MSDDPLDYPGRPERVLPGDLFLAPTPTSFERSGTTDTGPTPTVDLIGGRSVSGSMSPGASTGGQAGGVVPSEISGDDAFPPGRRSGAMPAQRARR